MLVKGDDFELVKAFDATVSTEFGHQSHYHYPSSHFYRYAEKQGNFVVFF